MDVFISLIISIFEEGFIYGIMAIGVYITYKVLDFPDLTVDGSFPLGMCFTGLLISVGVDPWIALCFIISGRRCSRWHHRNFTCKV